jgi:hypothetical protein
MCTDTALPAIDIVRLYGLRFKIELSFKQAVHQIGTFTYHFWMFDMKPRRRNDGNQHLHRASPKYRDDVKRKLHDRGRDGHCWPPPAQIRTRPIKASGSYLG